MQGTITLEADPESDAYLLLTVARVEGGAVVSSLTTDIHREEPLQTALWAWAEALIEAVRP